MAWRCWAQPASAAAPGHASGSAFAAWREGTFVNLLNPKIIVFMFAFLPPFVHPQNGSPLLQLLAFGLIFNIGGTLINIAVAASAGRIPARAINDAKAKRWIAAIASSAYLIIAARIAFVRP